jgi:hypothetical protein
LGGMAKQNGITPRCIGGVADHVHLLLSLPTTVPIAKSVGLTMTSTVPPGRGLSASLPRHFVPGYDQPVPPGQTISLSFRDKSHSPIEAPDNYLSAYEVYPGLNYLGPSGCMMKIVSLPNKDPIPLFHFGSVWNPRKTNLGAR